MTILRRINNANPVFQNWMEDIFAPVQNFSNGRFKASIPAVNIAEDENKYAIEFAVPGMSKSDFSINLENDVLIVKSEKENLQENINSTYTRKEFSYSSFQRSFTIPESANSEAIRAEYKDGILSIEIPKREEAKAKPPREIEIG